MNNLELKNGTEYHLENEDEGYELDFSFEQITSWDNPYKVWFNGKLYSYKTFTAAKSKVNQLATRFNLTEREV
jgi:hypothetical protein